MRVSYEEVCLTNPKDKIRAGVSSWDDGKKTAMSINGSTNVGMRVEVAKCLQKHSHKWQRSLLNAAI